MTFNNSISGSQIGADICVHFSPLLNLEAVFTLTNPLLAVTSQKAGSRHKRVNIIGQVKKFLFFVTFMCVFSHILYFFMDSFRSTRWPCHILYSTVGNLSVFLTFLCRLCVRFLIYVMFVLFSVRSVLCPVYMYCVLLDDRACPPFFVHVRLRSFESMTPPFILTIPVLFLFILCCFPFEFRFVCFVSRLHVLCPVFGFPSRCNLFSICCLVRLLSCCPGYVFRPVFYSTNATFFVELEGTKTKFTSLRQYHFICTVL